MKLKVTGHFFLISLFIYSAEGNDLDRGQSLISAFICENDRYHSSLYIKEKRTSGDSFYGAEMIFKDKDHPDYPTNPHQASFSYDMKMKVSLDKFPNPSRIYGNMAIKPQFQSQYGQKQAIEIVKKELAYALYYMGREIPCNHKEEYRRPLNYDLKAFKTYDQFPLKIKAEVIDVKLVEDEIRQAHLRNINDPILGNQYSFFFENTTIKQLVEKNFGHYQRKVTKRIEEFFLKNSFCLYCLMKIIIQVLMIK